MAPPGDESPIASRTKQKLAADWQNAKNVCCRVGAFCYQCFMFGKTFRLIRAALAALALSTMVAQPVAAQDAAALTRGLDLMRKGDWDGALATAGPRGSVARDIVQWNRLRASKGSFAEAVDFLSRHPDDFFTRQRPQTGWGTLRFARSLWDTGAKQEAMAEAIRGWTKFSIGEEEEAQFMVDWPRTLAKHHWTRTDEMLWRGATGQARRMLPRLDDAHKALAAARIALRDEKPGVDVLIEAIPSRLRNDPGLAYERFLWRARKGRNDSAIELLLERSRSAKSLGRPAVWGSRRAQLARWAMREGKPRTAYRLAANHHIASGSTRNDLEWLAGYIALRKLGDAETALRHFNAFAAGVTSPISLGRAGYWQGRALEALGRTSEAREAYRRGGQHQTSFYGLLAAEKAGLSMQPALTGAETFPGYRQAPFWNSSVMDAARLSLAAGELYYAERFLIQLSEGAPQRTWRAASTSPTSAAG